jgi:hypothetical protein
MCLPRELGGMSCPLVLYLINTELFARADVSTMAHFGFHGGMAMAMLVFSIQEGSTEVDPATGTIKKTRFGDYIAARSSSPRATANTTSSSRAPRRSTSAAGLSPGSTACRCSSSPPTRPTPTATAGASSR